MNGARADLLVRDEVPMTETPLYTAVFAIIKAAMIEQDTATYLGHGSTPVMANVCHIQTRKILELL